MAIAPVNKFLSIAVPVAPGLQKLYEVPTGTSALVLYAQVANVGVGTYPTVTFIQRRESRSTGLTRDIRVIKDVEIPPNDGVILVDGRMVLEKTPLIIDRIYISGTQSGLGTVCGVTYDEPLGIVTVTTKDDHGFSVGDQITMSGIAFTCAKNTSGITTTIFPDPQASYLVTDVLNSVEFTTNVGSANGILHFYNPSIHSFVRAKQDAVMDNSSLDQFTPSNAIYDPKTGDLVLTIKDHDILGSGVVTRSASDASYVPSTGVLTLNTATAHGFVNGDVVKIDDNSLAFKCTMDSNTAIKTYPRSTDPISGVWKPITYIDATSFSINVGKSPINYFSVADAEYDPQSGIATLDIGSHNLTANTSIRFSPKSLSFKCALDNYTAVKNYPRPSGYQSAPSDDPAYNTAVNITKVTNTTISVDILSGTSPTNTDTHVFVPQTPKQPSNASYNQSNGVMTLTINGHGFEQGDAVQIADRSITFSCTYGDGGSDSYPRPTDPASGKWLPISNVTTNTFDVNVGDAGIASGETHQFESATAGVTRSVVKSGGNYTHTSVPASFVASNIKKASKSIGIGTESLIFTCSHDGDQSEHAYPRTTDPAHNANLAIIEASGNTITVNVGVSTSGGLVAPLQMEFLASILENSNA